jgi:hypothetical protein
MIAVLSWVDGFGADTLVEGIFETLEQAQQYFPWDRGEETPRKYQEFDLNEETYFDYYGQPYLHKRKRKVYRIVKWKKKERV